MASRTISVTEEVYDLLSKEKLPGESFSVTLTRLVKDKGSILDFAGAWEGITQEELKSIKEGMGSMRETMNRRLNS